MTGADQESRAVAAASGALAGRERDAPARTRRGRIFTRYWISVSVLLTAFLVIGGAVEIVTAFRENVRRLAVIQLAETHFVANRTDQLLGNIERAVGDTASLPWRDGLLGLDDARQEFRRLLKVTPAITAVRGFGPDEGLVLEVSRLKPDWISVAPMGRTQGGAPARPRYGTVEYREDSQPFVTASFPVPSRGSFFGRMEADLDPAVLSEAIAGSSGRAYVLDSQGGLLAHSDKTLPLRRLNFRELPHVSALLGAAAPREVSGIRSFDLEGSEIVASGMPIRSASWQVFVEQPLELATRDARATALRTIVLVLAGLLAAVLVSLLAARRFSRPILELRRGAQRISSGDLGARISVATADEIETLADDFNRMASQLQEYTGGLERKVAEKTEALEKALAIAREALHARSLFLAAASHDLRQPLYAISILADALAQHEVPPAARAALEKQREAISVLQRLFDNLLDLSRFESGNIRANPRIVALHEVLASLSLEHGMIARAKGLEWHCEPWPCWVRTDPELVRRLLGNLLSNAVRYTRRGSVRIRSWPDGPSVKVEIADTGIGIPVQLQERVFEEFVQLDNPGRDRERGAGLGLSIVKRIDELLGTGLELESAPEAGTRVTIVLPRTEAPGNALADAPALRRDPEALSGCRIWIVEDDRLVREALASLLGSWEVDYAFAATRAELESLRVSDRGWPDAVILDDMLERGERGLDIALWLADALSRKRILLVTGNPDPARLQEIEVRGFRALLKPLSSDALGEWLREAVRSDPSGLQALGRGK
jgi:signal transduction histidine kinase